MQVVMNRAHSLKRPPLCVTQVSLANVTVWQQTPQEICVPKARDVESLCLTSIGGDKLLAVLTQNTCQEYLQTWIYLYPTLIRTSGCCQPFNLPLGLLRWYPSTKS